MRKNMLPLYTLAQIIAFYNFDTFNKVCNSEWKNQFYMVAVPKKEEKQVTKAKSDTKALIRRQEANRRMDLDGMSMCCNVATQGQN